VLEQQAILPEGTRDGLRVGITFTLAEGFEHSAGIDLGSWENYPDRASSALLGRWESTIDALLSPTSCSRRTAPAAASTRCCSADHAAA